MVVVRRLTAHLHRHSGHQAGWGRQEWSERWVTDGPLAHMSQTDGAPDSWLVIGGCCWLARPVGRSATTRQLGWEGEERGRAQSPTTHPWLQPGRATKTGPLGQRRSRCLRQGTSHHCVGLCRPPPDAASSGWVDRATWPEAVWSSTYGRGWLNVRHLLPTP